MATKSSMSVNPRASGEPGSMFEHFLLGHVLGDGAGDVDEMSRSTAGETSAGAMAGSQSSCWRGARRPRRAAKRHVPRPEGERAGERGPGAVQPGEPDVGANEAPWWRRVRRDVVTECVGGRRARVVVASSTGRYQLPSTWFSHLALFRSGDRRVAPVTGWFHCTASVRRRSIQVRAIWLAMTRFFASRLLTVVTFCIAMMPLVPMANKVSAIMILDDGVSAVRAPTVRRAS